METPTTRKAYFKDQAEQRAANEHRRDAIRIWRLTRPYDMTTKHRSISRAESHYFGRPKPVTAGEKFRRWQESYMRRFAAHSAAVRAAKRAEKDEAHA